MVYTMRTYTLVLSSNSTVNAPLSSNSTNSQTTWRVNWQSLFGLRTGEGRVRAKLVTRSFSGYSGSSQCGTVRINLPTYGSPNPFGIPLGLWSYTTNPTTAGNYFLVCDSSSTIGASFIIPSSNHDLVVTFTSDADAVQALTVAPYTIILYFDIEDPPNLVTDDQNFIR
jgi:hypothetical protein